MSHESSYALVLELLILMNFTTVGPRISEPLLSECSVYPKETSCLCNSHVIHHVRFKYLLTGLKMAASTCRKRKQVVLSLENKLSILNTLAKGEKATKVASEFGIGNSTVTDLKKEESRIRLFVLSLESLSVCSKERKIPYSGKFS